MEHLLSRSVETLSDDDYDYYFRFCGGLSKSDIPIFASIYSMYSLIACKKNSSDCYPLVSKFNQDYFPIDKENLSKGIIIYFRSQPMKVMDEYQEWEIFGKIQCDPQQNSTKYPLNPILESDGYKRKIHFSFSFSGACPKSAPPPSPTPIYHHFCDFMARDPSNQNYGISLDLSNFNIGPGGQLYHFNNNISRYNILYQPCERIHHISGIVTQDYPSVLLCTEDFLVCKNYGIADQSMHMSVSPSLIGPIEVTMKTPENNTARIAIDCDSSMPPGRLHFSKSTLSHDNRLLEVFLLSRDVCIFPLPPPIPLNDCHCFFNDTDANRDIKVSFNASSLDINGGYHSSVSVFGGFPAQRQLIFQPCSGVFCPTDADCGQYEDAHIWLCEFNNIINDTMECEPYGLFKHNLSMTRMPSGDLLDGIRTKYIGGGGRYTEVDFLCDHSIPKGEAILPNHVILQEQSTILSFSIRSSDSCPIGTTPTPVPPFYPDYPDYRPYPSPLPSPNSHLFYSNETHFVYINLLDIDQPYQETVFDIVSKGSFRRIHHFWKPWGDFACPQGGDCKQYDFSTSWSCWFNIQDHYVCYPIGDTRLGVKMKPIDEKRLDLGAHIVYNGPNNVRMELRSHCYEMGTQSFPLGSQASYSIGMGGIEYSFTTNTQLTCPSKLSIPFVPVPSTITPKPSPNYQPPLTAKFSSNGNVSILDLTKFSPFQKDLYIGRKNYFEKAVIYGDFSHPIPCLRNYICDKYDIANFWKCFDNNLYIPVCFPIGDSRFGLDYSLINKHDLSSGISVTFKGGLDNYSIRIETRCNQSIPINTYISESIGFAPDSKTIILTIYTSGVCIHSSDSMINSLRVWPLAVYGLGLVLFLYLGISVLTGFFKDNIIVLPFHETFDWLLSLCHINSYKDDDYQEI